MGDIPEDEFHRYVGEWFRHHYGQENVSHEVYLDATGRYADFIINSPIGTLCVEVENDFESVMNGTGQAVLYGTHYPNTISVVVVPAEHTESPEYDYLRWRTNVVVIELPYPNEYNN